MRDPGKAYPVALVGASILSVQWGAAVAFDMFDRLGPGGTVFLRVGFAALLLMALWRPALRGRSPEAKRTALLFGISFAAMNFAFYEGLERVPLGIAVTLEFVGPLGVAIIGSRRARDLLWVALAGGGILLLSPGLGSELDALGAALCLLAGVFWGIYIYLAERAGQQFAGGDGLAIAMVIATALLVPIGLAEGGVELLEPELLVAGVVIAVLSSALPYSLELEALRYLPKPTFGVMMSLEPGVAALVGFVALGQDLDAAEVVAIGLVVAASAGALGTTKLTVRDG